MFHLQAWVLPELELVAESDFPGNSRSEAEKQAKLMIACDNPIDEKWHLKTLLSR
ncbi:hypothetical protein [Microcoleus sp. B13-B6]|uniref:hypothetical protein n=1 Tax=Microcoleus sp. B13-B6 TaxID=2818652 RepID=UPI002FD0841F